MTYLPRLLGLVAVATIAAPACRSASLPPPQQRVSHGSDSVTVTRAATAFLAAFDSLQWEPFRRFLAEDITMFFPFSDTPGRVDGRAAVEARFRPFFERGQQAFARSGRTNMGIAPRDLLVQLIEDAAVVSFQLGDEPPARRSVVFRRVASGEWKVVHWHASSAPQPPSAPPPPS